MDTCALLNLAEAEEAARATLDDATWSYMAGGAGGERTVRDNIAAFEQVWLRPRICPPPCDRPHTGVTLLGHTLSMPVLLAPTSPQRLFHPDAELATARAAAAAGVASIVSTDSHYPFPAVRETAGRNCWFQLYAYTSRAHVEATIDMATDAGAEAIVVTVDASYSARRLSARRAGFRTPGNVDFGTLRMLGVLTDRVPAEGRLERLALSWADLAWVRDRVQIPLLVKGVLHAGDARRCIEVGADGIIVSNHGGRQLDSVVPSLVALCDITASLGEGCTVLVDGGVRSGVDVVKALALGADAVCIGRPYLWGLTLGGQAGVEAVLALLRLEIEDTLRQLGVGGVAELGRHCIQEKRR